MPIKRRSFVESLLVTPVIPAVAAAQQTPTQKNTPAQQPTPQPNTPAVQVPRQPQAIPPLKLTEVDVTAETNPIFFTPEQFATLKKLGSVLMPPMKKNPGAIEAQAPQFLDFLISVSPGDRQKLYQHGLDALNEQAKKHFHAEFAELDPKQIDAILRPVMVVRPWPEDTPTDPLKNFVSQVHEDLRTATVNSREWAEANASTVHRFRRGFNGVGLYWKPIDPIIEG